MQCCLGKRSRIFNKDGPLPGVPEDVRRNKPWSIVIWILPEEREECVGCFVDNHVDNLVYQDGSFYSVDLITYIGSSINQPTPFETAVLGAVWTNVHSGCFLHVFVLVLFSA